MKTVQASRETMRNIESDAQEAQNTSADASGGTKVAKPNMRRVARDREKALKSVPAAGK